MMSVPYFIMNMCYHYTNSFVIFFVYILQSPLIIINCLAYIFREYTNVFITASIAIEPRGKWTAPNTDTLTIHTLNIC